MRARQLHPVAQAKLAKDRSDVGLGGVLGDDEFSGDLGVRETAGEEAQDPSSLDVSAAKSGGGSFGAAAVKRSISRLVTAGAKRDPPSATILIPDRSCCSGASLSKKPLAPARSAS